MDTYEVLMIVFTFGWFLIALQADIGLPISTETIRSKYIKKAALVFPDTAA